MGSGSHACRHGQALSIASFTHSKDVNFMIGLARILLLTLVFTLAIGCQSMPDRTKTVAGHKPAGPNSTADAQSAQSRPPGFGAASATQAMRTPKKPRPAITKKPPQACEGNTFTLKDLPVDELSLSNQDIITTTRLLSVMGYSTIDLAMVQPGNDTQRYACEQLPLIVLPSLPAEEQLTHGRDGSAGGGGAGGYTGDLTIRQLRKANSGELDRLLVFYHPEREEALLELGDLVTNRIDTPSTQVYIETLVLEVSEEDSKELGVQWESAHVGNQSLLSLGRLETKSGDSVSFERNTRTDDTGALVFLPGTGVQLKLRALVESGRAQILSRPSILALSNRQAVIQIVDVLQTPRVQSAISQTGNLVISAYEFEPLPLGITLNLRPRVSADRKWVSLELDATVEAEVDENNGEIFAPDPTGGRILLAEKQGSASRKVKTFARIPDRTPIIIGGLSAGKRENQKSRVPLLGEIPLVGALFGATDNEVQNRELMIVLTPHVLAEDSISVLTNTSAGSPLLKEIDTSLTH